jgi:hypothetical protein
LGYVIARRNLGLIVDPVTIDFKFVKLRTPVEEDAQSLSPGRFRG